jgi:polycomb group RING finger protein 4
MESIFGNSSDNLNNIPQIRYLQAPAAFKVIHLKKFLSSKYDLSNLKKSMNIDIIYEGDIQNDDFSLMDIAYAYSWKRVSVIAFFFAESDSQTIDTLC